jgi:hypothetical protein
MGGLGSPRNTIPFMTNFGPLFIFAFSEAYGMGCPKSRRWPQATRSAGGHPEMAVRPFQGVAACRTYRGRASIIQDMTHRILT